MVKKGHNLHIFIISSQKTDKKTQITLFSSKISKYEYVNLVRPRPFTISSLVIFSAEQSLKDMLEVDQVKNSPRVYLPLSPPGHHV